MEKIADLSAESLEVKIKQAYAALELIERHLDMVEDDNTSELANVAYDLSVKVLELSNKAASHAFVNTTLEEELDKGFDSAKYMNQYKLTNVVKADPQDAYTLSGGY
jgi:hypothetical protein